MIRLGVCGKLTSGGEPMGWVRENRRLISFFRPCIVLHYIAPCCNILTCTKRRSIGRIERIGSLLCAGAQSKSYDVLFRPVFIFGRGGFLLIFQRKEMASIKSISNSDWLPPYRDLNHLKLQDLNHPRYDDDGD